MYWALVEECLLDLGQECGVFASRGALAQADPAEPESFVVYGGVGRL